jgi:hypothetical protein
LRVIVDCCVAATCSTAPDGVQCIACLKAISARSDLIIVMTGELSDEWRCHNSRFGRLWLIEMYRLGRVEFAMRNMSLDLVEQRRELRCGATNQREERVFGEDSHLAIAAIETDGRIVSSDNEAHGVFARIAKRVGYITELLWADPLHPEDRILSWIAAGLRRRRSLELGCYAPTAIVGANP